LSVATFTAPNDAAKALKTAMDAFYGPDTPACFLDGCGDPATQNLGSLYGWDWQVCTDIPIDICAQGPSNDVFWSDCTDKNFRSSFSDGCKGLGTVFPGYKTTMINFDFIKQTYGFNLEGASNIILTNGVLDPWSAGAPTIDGKVSPNKNVFVFNIDGAAHHLDLRTPNTCDPPTVTSARYQVLERS
jgi:lysosomal Pro-X carboxypeptidase